MTRGATTKGDKNGVKPEASKLMGDPPAGVSEPVQLEVIDRTTADGLSRLAKAGLLRNTIRATRHLYPKPMVAARPLSDEERLRVNSDRERAKRKLKIARVLATEELLEEARQALEEAILCQGRAYAVAARLSEPEKPGNVLMSPLAASWGENLPSVRDFLSNGLDIRKMIQELERSLQ
jgi:hypothetical protein